MLISRPLGGVWQRTGYPGTPMDHELFISDIFGGLMLLQTIQISNGNACVHILGIVPQTSPFWRFQTPLCHPLLYPHPISPPLSLQANKLFAGFGYPVLCQTRPSGRDMNIPKRDLTVLKMSKISELDPTRLVNTLFSWFWTGQEIWV